MSLPTKSDLEGYNNKRFYKIQIQKINDIIVLNIKGNDQSNNEDKSTEFNETEANFQFKNIYNNETTKKSVIQRPNQILYYDNTRENQYPVLKI